MSIFVKVFTQFKYILLTTVVAFLLIAFAAWLPNLHLITKSMSSSSMTFLEKTNLVVSLLGSLRTNFTTWSLFITVSIATLAGIQLSLLVYYLKKFIGAKSEMGMSVSGILLGILGVGCVSCGSVILTSVIGLGSTTAIIAYLPLRGQEFGIFGIAILLVAIYSLLNKIKQPYGCLIRSAK